MDTQKNRHTETGKVSGISRPAAVSARLHLTRPVLWLTALLMLSLLLSTAVLAANYYRDADGDGYGNNADRTNKATTGYVSDNTDCDDTDSTVHPNAVEICENGIDNDCDGSVDEGCVTWYADADSDTYGNSLVSTVAAAQPAGYVSDNTDCDDTDGAIHPGAAEVCDGTDDEDCDGTVDEGCSTWYNDYDHDTYGDPNVTKTAIAQPTGYVDNSLDCDDNDSAIHPGAAEVCDGDDNDCDGSTDEGCLTWYEDGDGDTYGNAAVSTQAMVQPGGYVGDGNDCDDTDPAVNPGAVEVCDTIDNDCDGFNDEGCLTWYLDSDGDGYGDAANLVKDFVQPANYVADNTDCDDTDPAVNPGAAEISGDGIDNDCDGLTDEGAVWYEDNDGDGYGNPGVVNNDPVAPAGFVALPGDCDDSDPAVNPGATEVCDGINDEDCDGSVDEGCQTWYEDSDGDGFGSAVVSTEAVVQPGGYVGNSTDCDDTDAAVNPGAAEICGDGTDNDCDGSVDEGCQTWYEDADADGYGNAGAGTSAVAQPAGYVDDSTDCDDTDAAVNPGTPETCGDSVDNNCNGFVDEGCIKSWYQDADGDGYGNPAVVDHGDIRPAGYVPFPGDCDDTNAAVNPDAPEVCNDGLDNNCAGGVDEGCLFWYRDSDGDGFGDPGTITTAFNQPADYVADDSDCNDGDPLIYPGATEVCDGMDSDCDGIVDEGCMEWYRDADADGYGDAAVTASAAAQPAGYTDDSADCDDGDAAVNPGVVEVCADGVDNDCDGNVDEGCIVWYEDADADGYGNPSVYAESSDPPVGYVELSGDCDDTDPAVNPGMPEVCDDGLDNNCAGGVDEGCTLWYQDNDGDTYGSSVSMMNIGQPAGYVSLTGDCDDTNAAINPAAVEVCDGADNDCDGDMDEGCTVWYEDLDGDGYGNAAVSTTAVLQPAGYVSIDEDCNDADAAINPAAVEVCDAIDNDCDGITDEGCQTWYQDNDGDGFGDAGVSQTANVQPGGFVLDNTDCDDTDAAINPAALEICDGADNNCAGGVDEGCLTWYADSDGDGYGNAGVSSVSIVNPGGYVLDSTDCDDGNAAINPGASEVCDGVNDENCDGSVDEGCVLWYRDADGDGYGDAGDSATGITPPAGYIVDNTDCDDSQAAVNPGMTEICGDGLDNNCAGGVDEGCLTWYQDGDGDGYGNAAVSTVAIAQPAGYVLDNTDCDDTNPARNPGAVEVCDGIDNNCFGGVDEGCLTWYADSDGDGYGNAGVSMVAQAQPAGYVPDNTDCDDTNGAMNPGAPEICDGFDNNCFGGVDEGCLTWYEDADGDGYGNAGVSMVAQVQPAGYVQDNTDCDDTNAAVNPGAVEVCDNWMTDENCNGSWDEGCIDWYKDNDGDGYSDMAVWVQSKTQPAGYVSSWEMDCDDTNAAVHPGAVEVCDGIDNNCDWITDEGCLTWYQDSDGDGYGDPAISTVSLTPPAGHVLDNTDCDDGDPLVNPGAVEVCDGLEDEDCDGTVDEGCLTWYRDADNDGYGNAGNSSVSMTQPAGYVADSTDCDDTKPNVHPGATEVCDSLDNNCDGTVDEGCLTWYLDSDGDGYGNPGASTVSVAPPANHVSDNTDCDDGDPNIHPGAWEVCDGVNDENCDGTVDEGCATWYEDGDGDGYGNPGAFVRGLMPPPGYVSDNTDCNDTDPSIHPGALEKCDGVNDENCDGTVDEGCAAWYEDSDGDGFGNPGAFVQGLMPPPGYVADNTDCDDGDPNIHPGAWEVCEGVNDENCDGTVDEGCTAWYQDSDGDGYGDPGVSVQGLFPPPGHVADNTDCDDGDFNINPGAVEVCDGLNDENCDGTVDEGCSTWYQDADGDNYGDPAVFVKDNIQPPGFVVDATDCDDTDPTVHPGAVEVCDGIDNNCTGSNDETCKDCFQDLDGDGYGNPAVNSAGPCGGPGVSVALAGDCDDGDPGRNPGVAEVCGDGIDNDCDGAADESCLTWYADTDGDGFGDPVASTVAQFPPPGYVDDNTDCDDGDVNIHPGAMEVCDGLNDENCDGTVDENCSTWYQDSDGDGYGNPGASVQGLIPPPGHVSDNTDCNDTDPSIHPGAMEVCDGLNDDDCDGTVDEGCSTWYQDADGDGYGDPGVSAQFILPPGGFVKDNTDCDDGDFNVHPGVSESCDGIDNNCDGSVDEGCSTWYQDNDGDGFGDPAGSAVFVVPPGGFVKDNTDCDDGNFNIHPGANEVCDGVNDEDCDGTVDEGCQTWYLDGDGDGYGDFAASTISIIRPPNHVSDSTDCNDADPNIHPGASEICDGFNDENCNGSVDEGCRIWYQDNDGDNYGDPGVSITAVIQPAGFVNDFTDCNDADPAINPGAVEVCDNWNTDENCDGIYDDNCSNWYPDNDGDGFGDGAVWTVSMIRPAGHTSDWRDCDDTDAAINPAAAEICGDGIDNNCDWMIDEFCMTWYEDSDGDNFGNPSVSTVAKIQPAGYVSDDQDCDDTDAAIHPGVDEVCDGADNNCDGSVDEGCMSWYQDSDGDNYGDPGMPSDTVVQPAGYVSDNSDCDDTDAAINPGAAETCDGADNNCDGSVDEGCMTWYLDSDGDNYGDPGMTADTVVQPAGYVSDNSDCDDADAAINPGAAEACDGADNNCDGSVDEGCMTWYLDSDGDNYGDPGMTADTVVQPAGYVSDNSDCNDADAAINPGAVEVCADGADNNCNGSVDEGCLTWYQDIDADNYGNAAVTVSSITKPAGYVPDSSDCNDTDATVNPGADELCNDGVDNNCNGSTDEDCKNWFRDADSDGYGSAVSTIAIVQPAGYVSDSTDCDDADAAINPAATEVCDGVDNDCDGSLDEGCVTWYEDTDGDGYGTAVSTVSVVQPVGYVDETGDCDDADAAIHPGASEVCDSADNDCDGNVDEGCTTWYADNDGDGYGSATSTVAILQPGGYVRMPGDCNDADPAISPAAIEACDGIDNDCDGAVDEGCVNWYEDFDGDNFGNAAATMIDVNKPAGYVSDDTDCDDTNPDINPGKNEVCGDGIDNDCDGSKDEGCQTWYLDFDGDTWGDGATTTSAVANPGGYATRQGDCDDTDAAVSPDAAEVCDGIDNDCDGFEDEGCVEWYQDNDGDGFGSVFAQAAFAQPAGYVPVSGDCNDGDAAVNPDAAEVCADGIDNNCNGTIDENCRTWYQDLDGDNYGNTAVSVRSIARPVGYVAANGDCNDANPVVHPYMLDLCDHMDNDCDGVFDEDVPPAEYKTFYLDWDGDGFGDGATGLEDCRQAFNRVLDATDCNDNNAEVHPGAFDICENGVDEDCSAGGDPSGDRTCGMATDKGCADIADVPLETLVNSADPIVLMLLDSSASMASEIMVPRQPDALYRGCAYYTEAISNKYVYWEAFHFETNTLYYNPHLEDYEPWDGLAESGPYAGGNYGDADLDNVADHPNQPASTSLDAKYSNSLGVDIPIAHYYLKSELEGKVYMIQLVPDGGGYAAKYYEVTTAASDPGLVSSLTLSANPPNDVKIKRTAAEARQNFANWYQYYRTRMLTASATLGRVVYNISGVQFGLNTVGVTSASFVVPTKVDETAAGETQRQAVLTAIYEAGTAESSTDLRKNFETLGEYLECNVRTDDCPWADAADGGECQLAFVLLMTDALYSKSSTTSVGDADSDISTAFDGAPFADCGSSCSDSSCFTDETLADIAMHYYERDLAPWLDDKVPTTAKDLAEHQHMITYAVSFGAKGTLNPKAYEFDHTSANCAEGAACPTVDGPCACAPCWPQIPETQYAEPEKIDDLYHAAVNGRGDYFATQNVKQLAQAMKDIFNAINERRGSGASVAVSTQELTEDTLLYRGLYNTAGWFGELGCWQISPLDGSVSATPTWLASQILDARDLAADPRAIFTFNPNVSSGVTFDLANLTTEQQNLLGDTDTERQRLIDFVKGDRTLELQSGGFLRNRVSRLGDIVHSAPVHVLYPSSEYIFVGGNDGMLHAFDASSSGSGGTEVFGYVPSLVFENLYHLADPDYDHKYYVDVTPYIDSSGLLVGGLGAGGKGYFALDVSDPTAFSSADVLWEYPPGADDDMGFTFAKPIIVPHQSGRLIVFGNGYDSKNGHAVLYVIRVDANNAITPNLGEGVVKIDTLVGTQSNDPANQTGCNGLSSTLATDVDYDNTLDYVYAGDLQGNMWKFDLTADAPADWDVFYEDASGNPAPLFTAEYAAGVPQPIYAKAGAMRHCLPNRDGYIIVFGTGKFFANGDYQDTSQQSIYGIWDWAPELEDGGVADPGKHPIGTPTRVTDYASVPIDLSAEGPTAVSLALIGQTAGAESGLYRETSSNRLYDRYIDPDGTPNNADDQRAWFDAETWAFEGAAYTDWRYVGWYFDLPNTGERVIADTTIRAGLAIMVSVDPSPTPCKPGGNSILQIIQACDGSRPPDEVLDFNEDGILNEDDYNWNRKELDDIYYKPVIIEDKMYFSEDDPETGPTEHLGVAYWRFLRLVHP